MADAKRNGLLLIINSVVIVGSLGFLAFRVVMVRDVVPEPVALSEPIVEETWKRLSRGDILGSEDGDVVAVEFLDYQCEYCERSQHLVRKWLRKHPKTAIAVLHYPLESHVSSEWAARVAICGGAQGRFREVHEELLSRSDWVRNPDEQRLASQLHLDPVVLKECMRSSDTSRRLANDLAAARELGITATPTYVSRRATHRGSLGNSTLSSMVNP